MCIGRLICVMWIENGKYFALTRYLAGFLLSAASLDPEEGQSAAQRLSRHGDVYALPLDLSNFGSIDTFVKHFRDRDSKSGLALLVSG